MGATMPPDVKRSTAPVVRGYAIVCIDHERKEPVAETVPGTFHHEDDPNAIISQVCRFRQAYPNCEYLVARTMAWAH